MLSSYEWIWKGKSPPPQVVEIYDPKIPQHQIIIVPETALDVPVDPYGPIKVSKPSIKGPYRSTRVRSRPDTYAPSMIGRRYAYAVTQLESQEVIHHDAHMFTHEYL